MDKNIKIIISAIDNATSGLQKVGSQIKDFGEKNKATFQSMRNVGAVAFTAIAFGAKEMVDSFAEAQAQMTKVDGILKTLGNDTIKKAGGSLDALKKSIEGVSEANIKLGFDDEDTATSLAKLTAATGDFTQAQNLNSLAMDLARYKGIGLAEASDTLIKVQAGQTRVLKELGIEVKEGTTAQEAFAIVQQKTAGQAKAFSETVIGQNQVMAVSIGNLKEQIGESLAPAFGKLVSAVQPLIQQFTDWAAKNPELLGNIILIGGALAGLVTVLGAIGLALPAIITGFTAMATALTAIGIAGGALIAIAAALLYFTSGGPTASIEETKNQMDALTASFNHGGIGADEYKKKMGELQGRMGELSEQSQTTTGQIKDAFDILLDDMAQGLFNFGEGVKKVFNNIGLRFTNLRDSANKLLDDSALAIANFIATMKAVFDGLNVYFANIRQAVKQAFVDAWEGIKSVVFGIIDSFTAGVKSKLEGIVNFAQGIISTITGLVSGAENLAGKVKAGVSSVVNVVGGAITGQRALGGTIMAGNSYLVGENGPEIVTPASTSRVSQPSAGGMSVAINLGGVVINNSQDENRLVQIIKNAFIDEARKFNLGITV